MEFTHLDEHGNAKMVDITDKDETLRIATATGTITMNQTAFQKVMAHNAEKGDVLTVSKVAGIMAAKNTATIIPMCHPIPITGIDINITPSRKNYTFTVEATVKTTGKTGVEMEALTAVHVTLLTIYDMVKALDKTMVMKDIYLLEKAGGKSGEYTHER